MGTITQTNTEVYTTMKDYTENTLCIIVIALTAFIIFLAIFASYREADLWNQIHDLQTTPRHVPASQDEIKTK